MKTLTLNIPDSVDVDNKEVAMLVATKFYEQGKLSMGQAAELVGYSKRAFMEILGDYKIPVFNYDAKELKNDVKNAGNYHL